jgi:hypothetical protein
MANEGIDLRIELDGDWTALRRSLHSATLTGATRRRAILHQWLDHLADVAEAEMHRLAPIGQSKDSGYIQSHIGKSGFGYEPGGAGGGGTYTLTTGVRRGQSLHPLYVESGTKNIYSSGGFEAILRGGMTGEGFGPAMNLQGRIYPRNRVNFLTPTGKDFESAGKRPALTFQKRGEPRKWRAWVTGQRPQRFVYRSFHHVSIYAKGQMRVIARNLIKF